MGADHALFPQAMAPDYPYSDTGLPPQTADHEYPDMWSSFAAMAAVTTQIKLVCGVYVLPIRNPIEVAKQAATLAILSEGRFALGAGTGWMKEEFDAYGVSFKGRGKRMDEMLDIMQGLWTGGMVRVPRTALRLSPHSRSARTPHIPSAAVLSAAPLKFALQARRQAWRRLDWCGQRTRGCPEGHERAARATQRVRP